LVAGRLNISPNSSLTLTAGKGGDGGNGGNANASSAARGSGGDGGYHGLLDVVGGITNPTTQEKIRGQYFGAAGGARASTGTGGSAGITRPPISDFYLTYIVS
jgi:hypothetical protein